MRQKSNAIIQMIQNLTAIPSEELGGFRIELTIRAQTLADAEAIAVDTPFLNQDFWLDPPDDMRRFKLDVKIVSKSGLIDNANWIYQQALSNGIFLGDNNAKLSRKQLRGLYNTFAGFGLNTGKRKVSLSLDKSAWWRQSVVDTATANHLEVLRELNKRFVTRKEISELVKRMQSATQHKSIPCRQNPDSSAHRYHIAVPHPLRFRCYLATCKDDLPLGQAMSWFAQMIVDDRVDRDKIFLQKGAPAAKAPVQARKPNKSCFIRPAFWTCTRHNLRPAWYSTNWIKGDGNCMFAAFGKAIAGDNVSTDGIRKVAVKWLRDNRAFIENFNAADNGMPEISYGRYVSNMPNNGTWGNNLVLHGLCTYYNVYARVLKKIPNGEYVWLTSGHPGCRKRIVLFLENDHYENLIPSGEMMASLIIG